MYKEARLSRLPSENEVNLTALRIFSKNLKVTADPETLELIKSDWAKVKVILTQFAKRIEKNPYIGKLRGRGSVAASIQLTHLPEQKWVLNWSASEKTMEFNVAMASKMSKTKVKQLLAFGMGCAWYDKGLKPKQRSYWVKTIKREKVNFQPIQKYLKFFEADQMGRPRAAFAFGFLMANVQVGKSVAYSPLMGMVLEFLHNELLIDDPRGYGSAVQDGQLSGVDSDNILGVEFDPQRFDLFNQKAERYMKNADGSPKMYDIYGVGRITAEDLMDVTGTAEFCRAIIKAIEEDPELQSYFGFRAGDITDQCGLSFSVDSDGDTNCRLRAPNGATLLVINREQQTTRQYNALCESHPKIQGKGLGVKMTASQITTAVRIGRKKIGVSAALGMGWRTWNKFGFETNEPVGYRTTEDKWWERAAASNYSMLGEPEKALLFKEVFDGSVGSTLRYFDEFGGGDPEEVPTVEAGPPPLPQDRFQDLKNIIEALHRDWSSYSSSMTRMLRNSNLPTTPSEWRDMWRNRPNTTITLEQQKAVHDYFTSGRSGWENTFRSTFGYPPREGADSTPSMSVDQKGKECSRALWQTGLFTPEELDNLSSLINSPEFEVKFRYQMMDAVWNWANQNGQSAMFNGNLASNTYKVNCKRMFMQDLMDVEGFSNWWFNNGSSWGGNMDLSAGVHSLPVAIMDQYRKAKNAKAVAQGNEAPFNRQRVATQKLASLVDWAKDYLDKDILDGLKSVDKINPTEGGMLALDVAMIEQSLRDAKIEKEEEEENKKKELAMLNQKIASRWLD